MRWLAYLAVTGLLGATVGRPWTLVWVLGLPAVGAVFHLIWCLRHGINPITAEPRDRYEQLRARRPAGADDDRPQPRHGPVAATPSVLPAGDRNSRYSELPWP